MRLILHCQSFFPTKFEVERIIGIEVIFYFILLIKKPLNTKNAKHTRRFIYSRNCFQQVGNKNSQAHSTVAYHTYKLRNKFQKRMLMKPDEQKPKQPL